jgi:ABC-type lipoprotein export system ATPase subunit
MQMYCVLKSKTYKNYKRMITIKNLTKIFRTEELETSALSGINLQINEGFLSIMGPSGCGKSTLLNIVGLLDSASGGVILVEPGND